MSRTRSCCGDEVTAATSCSRGGGSDDECRREENYMVEGRTQRRVVEGRSRNECIIRGRGEKSQ